jgi:hypothetical protein
MLRTIALLIVGLLVQPLAAQQDAANPFKIVLGNSTITALKNNPKGLVWPFDTLGLNSHDGVTVYYDPSESLVTTWKANDGTMQNLFSLDVTDEILNQIENDYGLPALISPSDRERIRGVLLRYVPPAGGSLPPTAAVGPVGFGGTGNVATPPVTNGGSSVLDNNRVTSNVNSGTQPFRPLGGNGGALTSGSPGSGGDFYQNRPAPLQPQANDFGASRPNFGGGMASPVTAAQGGGVAPPMLNQNLASQSNGDRFASSQPLLPPPVYNSNAGGVGAGAAANWQTTAQQEPMLPNRRPGGSQFPQVSYNNHPDNQAGGFANLPTPPAAGNMQSQFGGAAGHVAEGMTGSGGASGNWQVERQVLVADLAESKQRSVFLLFMLFLLTGLCLYLSWLARGFYFRYAELADELRETFSATS